MTRFQNLIKVHYDELPEADSIESAYKKLYDLPQRKRKDPLIRIAEKGNPGGLSRASIFTATIQCEKRGMLLLQVITCTRSS